MARLSSRPPLVHLLHNAEFSGNFLGRQMLPHKAETLFLSFRQIAGGRGRHLAGPIV
jgi:hypothetical protein